MRTSLALATAVTLSILTPLCYAQLSWTEISPLPEARLNHAAAAGPNGLIYSIGGDSTSGGFTRHNDVFAYEPSGGSWSPVASLPQGRGIFGAATGVDGRIYAIGGDT